MVTAIFDDKYSLGYLNLDQPGELATSQSGRCQPHGSGRDGNDLPPEGVALSGSI